MINPAQTIHNTAQHSCQAQPVLMQAPHKPLNIHLVPHADLVQLSQSVNTQLNQHLGRQAGGSAALDLVSDHSPHITLYLATFDGSLSAVQSAVAACHAGDGPRDKEEQPPLSVMQNEEWTCSDTSCAYSNLPWETECEICGQQQTPPQRDHLHCRVDTVDGPEYAPLQLKLDGWEVRGSFIFLKFGSTQLLQQLHEQVVTAALPLTSALAATPAWISELPLEEQARKQQSLDSYKTPNAMDEYSPHLTVGIMPVDPSAHNKALVEDVMNTALSNHLGRQFLFESVAVGNVGQYGTLCSTPVVVDAHSISKQCNSTDEARTRWDGAAQAETTGGMFAQGVSNQVKADADEVRSAP